MKKQIQPELEKEKIADKIISCLEYGKLITIALIAPFGLYNLFLPGKTYYFRQGDLHKEMRRLQKSGYIALTKTRKGLILRLLQKGVKRWRRVKLDEIVLPRQGKWDTKWRFFIFDIPEKQRAGRDLLRKKLKELGMYNMQRSVFVYPFDCRKELEFITQIFNLEKYASFIEADYTDIDRDLIKYFKSLIK